MGGLPHDLVRLLMGGVTPGAPGPFGVSPGGVAPGPFPANPGISGGPFPDQGLPRSPGYPGGGGGGAAVGGFGGASGHPAAYDPGFFENFNPGNYGVLPPPAFGTPPPFAPRPFPIPGVIRRA